MVPVHVSDDNDRICQDQQLQQIVDKTIMEADKDRCATSVIHWLSLCSTPHTQRREA